MTIPILKHSRYKDRRIVTACTGLVLIAVLVLAGIYLLGKTDADNPVNEATEEKTQAINATRITLISPSLRKIEYPADDFHLILDNGFVEIPSSDVNKVNEKIARNPDAGSGFQINYAFGLKDREPFTYPYITLKIDKSGKLSDDDIKKTFAIYDGTKKGKKGKKASDGSILDKGFDPERKIVRLVMLQKFKDVGSIINNQKIYFTDTGYILISFHCREREYEKYKLMGEAAVSGVTVWESEAARRAREAREAAEKDAAAALEKSAKAKKQDAPEEKFVITAVIIVIAACLAGLFVIAAYLRRKKSAGSGNFRVS